MLDVPKGGAALEIWVLPSLWPMSVTNSTDTIYRGVFLCTDLAIYDSVKQFLLLNTPLVDNVMTHSVARCRIPPLPLFC